MEIISRIIPAKPRNKELYFLKSTGSYIGGSSSSGSSGGIGSPSYWDLITTDEEGNPIATPYITTIYPVVSEKEITAYGVGASESDTGVSALYQLSDVDPSVENAPENSILKKIGTHWKAVSGDLQPLLVSGTNIATINGQNLLNGGNILIEAGSSYERLDSWVDYAAGKEGWVLSALLGKNLDTRVSLLEGGSATTVTTTGTGNAITSLTKSGSVITANKGLTFALASHTHTFASLTNKPTTLAGYGITDAVTLNTTQTITGEKTFTGNVLIKGLAGASPLKVRGIDGYLDDTGLLDNLYLNFVSTKDIIMVMGGGNVGIGTTNPLYKLDVSGTGRFTGNVTASAGVNTPKVDFGNGFTIEPSGTELVFKYNGVIKQRMLSNGTILGTGGITALATN